MEIRNYLEKADLNIGIKLLGAKVQNVPIGKEPNLRKKDCLLR